LRFNFTTSCKRGYDKEETVIHSDGTVTSELDTDVDYVLDLDNSERDRQAENDVADAVNEEMLPLKKRHVSAKLNQHGKARAAMKEAVKTLKKRITELEKAN
jgi:hypothetical protein